MTTSANIEKLFQDYIKEIGGTPGGFAAIFKLEDLEEGDPKTLGREIKRGADILEKSFNFMDFQPWELEKGKTGARLKEAIRISRKMGEEIEQMDEKEAKQYYFYIITILIDVISSLINHIQVHMVETHR